MAEDWSSVEQVKTGVSLADLQRLDADDKWVEVEDGEIIARENHVTFLHLIVIQNLFRILDPFVRLHHLGTVYMDGVRYILAGTTTAIQRAHKPDFSFLRAGRIPPDFDWSGDFVGAPDLAVEVASPGQTNSILLPKITRYLQAESEEAWLIYPVRRTLYQYRGDAEEPVIYRDDAIINTSVLFPGLTLPLRDLFITETM
jgi:Uma2 family endonuclease